MTEPHRFIAICRAHGHWFQVDRAHEPCPEPGCEAACDYYALISDAQLKVMAADEISHRDVVLGGATVQLTDEQLDAVKRIEGHD